jgi:hypothetical protein
MPVPPPPIPLQKQPRLVGENDLFLAVLPLVHCSRFFAGEWLEEVMTLVPDRNLAAEFNPGEVDNYIQTFRNAAEPKFGERGRKYNYAK